MCSACGFPAAPGHWTEAGAASPHERLRSRLRRVDVLQRVLRPLGLRAFDGGPIPGFQLAGASGQRALARDLEEVWVAVERMGGEPLDPLDPRYTGTA